MRDKRLIKTTYTGMCFAMTLAVASTAIATGDSDHRWHGGARVTICHIPRWHPDRFHTIRVSQRALRAFARFGDYIGGPCNDICSELCDDGNACTIDDTGYCNHHCPEPTPVDCDDGDPCTIDSCDAVEGCVNEPSLDCACPCFDSADLAALGATPADCSIGAMLSFIDSRPCTSTEAAGRAQVQTIPTTECRYLLQEPDTGGVCGTTFDILEAVSPSQADACLALLLDACPAP